MLESNPWDNNNVQVARVYAFIFRRRYIRPLMDVKKSLRAAQARHNRSIKSKSRHRIISAKRGNLPDKYLEQAVQRLSRFQKRKSVLLSGFMPDREDVWQGIASRRRTRRVESINVTDFSFFKNPNETCKLLNRIAKAEATCLASSLNFMDTECQDLGPFLILSAMRGDMAPVFLGGGISNQLSKIFSALELENHLGMRVSPIWSSEKDIWAFPVKRRRPAGSTSSQYAQLEPQTKEKTGDALCEQIDEWLDRSAKQELTTDGRRHVKSLIGEVLDNAERHGSHRDHPNDGDWIVSGMMVKASEQGEESFTCQLAFLSVGSSISESLETCSQEIKQVMDEYVARHRHCFPDARISPDHLRTIFALQPGITRDAEAQSEGRGGTGFSDIIRFFADLAGMESEQCTAKLAVVSGRTCLHIKYPYCTASGGFLGEPLPIWMNAANSHEAPPDTDNVIELDFPLQGTLVTMSFRLDTDYLERTADGTAKP